MTDIVINAVKIGADTQFQYKQNPKRSGSKAHARYELYQTTTNLVDYLAVCEEGGFAKYGKADLRYDTEKLHLILLDAEGEILNVEAADAKLDAETVEEIREFEESEAGPLIQESDTDEFLREHTESEEIDPIEVALAEAAEVKGGKLSKKEIKTVIASLI